MTPKFTLDRVISESNKKKKGRLKKNLNNLDSRINKNKKKFGPIL